MAIDDRTRHDRLRGLMPDVYATDPATSALGQLLEVLADRLRDVDRALERALRDKWLSLASGARSLLDDTELVDLHGPRLPLELLGAALDLVRQPWETDHEHYRNRVRLLAPLLARGLGTPRVVLAFALTALHSEPCPVLERTDDETTGWGMPPRTLARCRTCQGGNVPPQGASCPLREQAIMRATVTDTPRTRAQLQRLALTPEATANNGTGILTARLRVRSNSLFSARPDITLQSLSDTPIVPSFRSLRTGEQLVVAHAVGAEETLEIHPDSLHRTGVPRHAQYWVDHPPGAARNRPRAWVTDGQRTTRIEDKLFLVRGARFDHGRFVDDHVSDADPDVEHTRFAVTTRHEAVTSEPTGLLPHLDSIEVPLGDSTWVYQPLDRAGLGDALADVAQTDVLGPRFDFVRFASVSGDPDDGPQTRFATGTDALVAAPETVEPVPVDLTLGWWTRPPACFRVRIPRTAAVTTALAHGAGDYLRQIIERVRPAGTHAVIDIAEPAFVESVVPADRLLAIEVRAPVTVTPQDRDRAAGVELALPSIELEPVGQAGFTGLFDTTRLDLSRASELTVEPGRFQVTFFDYSLAGELATETAVLDGSYFDNALVAPDL